MPEAEVESAYGPSSFGERLCSLRSQCDAFRPCSICVKAGVECINRPSQIRSRAQLNHHAVSGRPRHSSEEHPTEASCLGARSPRERRNTQAFSKRPVAISIPSSDAQALTCDEDLSIVNLAEEDINTQLFTQTRGHLMGPTSTRSQPRDIGSDHVQPDSICGIESRPTSPTRDLIDSQNRAILPWSYSRATTISLLALLPPRPICDYLINVYFNTVHWFMVIIHEGHFLHHYRSMMDMYERNKQLVRNSDEDFTFALLVLTIVALGGRYTSTHTARLRRCNLAYRRHCAASKPQEIPYVDQQEFEAVRTTSQLFSAVRSNATDNLACGTLATVQSLLLLGSLYLFHGDINLAWSNSGSVIRATQALELHKENSETRWNSSYYQSMDNDERRQLRWRLFWAVHTSDRFLAMCYSLPLAILDEDCNAGIPCEDNIYPPPGSSSFLMIEDDLRHFSSARPIDPSSRPITLLTYQTYKLQFYILLGQIVRCLYRQSHGGVATHVSKYDMHEATGVTGSSKPKPTELIEAARTMEHKLRRWFEDLPKSLRLSANLTYPAYDEPH